MEYTHIDLIIIVFMGCSIAGFAAQAWIEDKPFHRLILIAVFGAGSVYLKYYAS